MLTLTTPCLIQVYRTPNSSDHDNTIKLLAPNDLFAQAKATQPASPQTSVRDSMKIQNMKIQNSAEQNAFLGCPYELERYLVEDFDF